MFELTPDQQKKLTEWFGSIANIRQYGGAVGGRFTYEFTPTSLGVVIKVTDSINKTSIDLTDYESW